MEGKQEGGALGAKLRKCFKERLLGRDESSGRMSVRDALVYSFLSCVFQEGFSKPGRNLVKRETSREGDIENAGSEMVVGSGIRVEVSTCEPCIVAGGRQSRHLPRRVCRPGGRDRRQVSSGHLY